MEVESSVLLQGIDANAFLEAVLRMDLRKLIATEIVEFLPRLDDTSRTRFGFRKLPSYSEL